MKPLLRSALAFAVALLVLPAGAHAAQPGLNVASLSDVPAAISEGAQQVRFFVLWDELEPSGPNDLTETTAIARPDLITAYENAADQIMAAGRTPLIVVVDSPQWASGSTEPRTGPRPQNTQDFANFFAEIVRRISLKHDTGQPQPVFEVWNEQDASEFWGRAPEPAVYADMLGKAYRAGKAANKDATILMGPTTGNNYQWIEAMYANGAKGSFDGVAVHTDTACLDRGPDFFYRDPAADPLQQGPIGQFSFLGYRSIREVMLANGDDKPIWMTEIGWSSTGGVALCERGSNEGKKPSGVSEADQAAFLTKAFQCMQKDPYLVAATWFTYRDAVSARYQELTEYGLLRTDGSQKPVYQAFKALDPNATGACGDFEAPSITVLSPTAGQQFVDKFDIKVSASDGGVGLGRISAYVNKVDLNPFSAGGGEIKNWTTALTNNKVLDDLAPWQSSGRLPVGQHTVYFRAVDLNGNAHQVAVPVVKVAPGALRGTLTPTVRLPRKVTCKKRTCSLRGSLGRPAGGPSIGGKVSVEWQFRNKKGKWRKLVGGTKPASKAWTFTAKLKLAGRWRVRVVYPGVAPYKKLTSKFVTFRVR